MVCLQTTAFFLAVLLGMLGAANFYIGRLNYAIPQLIIFILGTCGGGAVQLRRFRAEEEPLTGGRPKKNLLVQVATGFAPFVVVIWWIVDMFIFAKGYRRGHDKCPLVHDF